MMNKVKLFAMDVDGVLTDGGMYYSEKGEVMKKFDTRDGMGIELLRKSGIIPVIITKEKSKIVLKRAEKLEIEEVHMGIQDKVGVVKKLIKKYNLGFNDVAYIGDDINDLELLKKVGFSSAPNDAVEKVKRSVDYVSTRRGGNGAVREVIDFILSKSDVV
ncbi:MAG: HAD hydrolase family protein [Nanoarchaeota archaeon]|nr:HAD hydrolase family protein [Nanoarchaeota archaeon]